MRLIDGDRLEDVIEDECFNYSGENDFNVGIQNGLLIARDFVQEAPTIDAELVKHGKWIQDGLVSTSGGTYGVSRCSLCKVYYQDVGCGWNYCPHCGALMKE